MPSAPSFPIYVQRVHKYPPPQSGLREVEFFSPSSCAHRTELVLSEASARAVKAKSNIDFVMLGP